MDPGRLNLASPNLTEGDKCRDISRDLALRKDKELMERLAPRGLAMLTQ